MIKSHFSGKLVSNGISDVVIASEKIRLKKLDENDEDDDDDYYYYK